MKTKKMNNVFESEGRRRGRCRLRESALNGFVNNCVGIRKNGTSAVLKFARFRTDGTFRNFYFREGRI